MRAIRFSPIWSDAAPPSTRPWTRGDWCSRSMPLLRALNSTTGKRPWPLPPAAGGLGTRLAPHELLEYERGYDRLQQRFRVDTLCLYDAEALLQTVVAPLV